MEGARLRCSAPRIAHREDRRSAAREGYEMRRGLLVVLLAGITAAAWTAVGSQAGTKHSSSGSSVTIANVAGMSWTCGFNPFNSTVQFLSFGPIYEELVFVNELKSGATTPWLASKFKWSNHAQDAHLHDQEGRQVVGRQAAHRGDVLFTFQLLKKHKALDLQAVWSVLKSVSRKGATRSSSSSSPRRRRTSTTSPARRRSCRSTSGPRSRTRSSTRTRPRSAVVPTR